MNIFLLSADAEDFQHHMFEQVTYHCDRHVVKMILESSQLMSTAIIKDSVLSGQMLREGLTLPCSALGVSHQRHPCAIWASSRVNNLHYLAHLALELCHEHQYRYPLSLRHEYMNKLESVVDYLDETQGPPQVPSTFPVAISDRPDLKSDGRHYSQVWPFYRAYYYRQKRLFATWRRRETPHWWQEEQRIFESQDPSTSTA